MHCCGINYIVNTEYNQWNFPNLGFREWVYNLRTYSLLVFKIWAYADEKNNLSSRWGQWLLLTTRANIPAQFFELKHHRNRE